ncbi:MAG: retroviral-like aspartic protease family protein, partial [Chloroflexota bacterium]|nr:retroviral-like aspartic protease family protein [Chloroflexota bacterium]
MSCYARAYDSTYHPPAAVVEATVRAAGEQAPIVTLTALVDSGADGTMIPIDILRAVGARYVETRQMRGVTGVAYTVDLYLVTIQIGSHVVRGIRVVAQGAEPLIGRDVLNQLVITLATSRHTRAGSFMLSWMTA